MLNLFQHLINLMYYKTLKRVQGDSFCVYHGKRDASVKTEFLSLAFLFVLLYVMHDILKSFAEAVGLIFSFNRELYSIILLSLKISGSALIGASLLGVPIGAIVGMKRFFGKGIVISVLNTFMGLPPVAVGLFFYLLFSRRGPLGFLGILYSPSAMVIAQTALAMPIVAALSHSAVASVDKGIRHTAATLGATPFQTVKKVIVEARYSIMAAVIAGFGRIIAEVGAILIVGGNIDGYTRVMTTTIALETDKGNFVLALGLGIVLVTISLIVNIALHRVQGIGVQGD